MLDSTFVADESKALVDQEVERSSRLAYRVLRCDGSPGNIPEVGKLSGEGPAEDAARQIRGAPTTYYLPSSGARTVVAAHAELETAQV